MLSECQMHMDMFTYICSAIWKDHIIVRTHNFGVFDGANVGMPLMSMAIKSGTIRAW